MKTSKRVFLIAIVVALVVFASGCTFGLPPKIADAIMTETVDEDGIPGEEVVSFPADAPMLYTSAKILNAPDNTQIRIVWTYVTGEQLMDEITLDSGTISDRYIYSNFEPSALLPEGDYRVDYYIEDHEEPDATVKFVVVAGATQPAYGATVSDAHMASFIDENGVPSDTIESVPTTGTWYVSAILSNTQPDTVLHFVWYDTDRSVVDTVDIDPQGATDIYIYSSLKLTGTAPEGQYQVGIFVNDSTDPSAVVSFTASNNA